MLSGVSGDGRDHERESRGDALNTIQYVHNSEWKVRITRRSRGELGRRTRGTDKKVLRAQTIFIVTGTARGERACSMEMVGAVREAAEEGMSFSTDGAHAHMLKKIHSLRIIILYKLENVSVLR
jgi:hypothetical protein